MFGYVTPDAKTLTRRDFAMFQSAYCGLCMSTKKHVGNLSRILTTYDATVIGMLLIEATKPDVEFATVRCVGDPRKKSYIKDFPLWRDLVDVNVLLSYYKAVDDRIDGGGKRRILGAILKKPYARAKARLPEADEIIAKGYSKLREAEQAGEKSIDRASDHFASLLKNLALCLLKDNSPESSAYYNTDDGSLESFGALCYNIGKFVYIADALDDVGEDFKAKRYNPFLASYGDYGKGGRKEFIEKHRSELEFLFASVRNRALNCFNGMRLTHVGGLLENIIADGLQAKTSQLLSSTKKLPPPTLKLRKKKAQKEQRKEQ
ncbi:MAG: hypothetical protein IJX05_03200 [Clostridia bacterium]|nr:hypothetical protein [Clostridia bacterium]